MKAKCRVQAIQVEIAGEVLNMIQASKTLDDCKPYSYRPRTTSRPASSKSIFAAVIWWLL